MTSLRSALAALVVAAVAALPGVALADGGTPPPPPPPGNLPACAAGQLPTPDSPCLLPPCPAGTQPTPQAPCALPPGTEPQPPQPGTGSGSFCPPTCPGPPAPGTQPGGPGAGPGGPFMQGFLSRVWRFTADADSYDAASNTLNVTVTKILNLPKKFATQDDEIVDQDADVVFTSQTKVFDKDGKRLKAESAYDGALDDADSISVVGKFVAKAKWDKDADGNPVTTIRAKRVTITG
jgi:hypothetical protein